MLKAYKPGTYFQTINIALAPTVNITMYKKQLSKEMITYSLDLYLEYNKACSQ